MSHYIELHAHSNFSLLDGASPPEALVTRAAELEMNTLALTDHNAVYGAVRFVQAARAQGIRPILGAELTLSPSYHLTLLAKDKSGWENLCHLISLAQHNAAKGEAALSPEQLADHTAGLIVLSGCKKGEIASHLLRKEPEAALAAARRYRELFGPGNFWIELQHHLLPEDEPLVAELVTLAQHLGLGYVATNNVHYARRADSRLQDILVCIQHQLRLAEAGPYLRPNSEFYLKPAQRLAPLFATYPQALSNTRRIAEGCQFELHYGLQDLPQFPTPNGLNADAYLKQLCQAAAQIRYPELPSRVQTQLAYELAVIEQANLSNYFLIVWDIVHFARAQGIRCQGRGSAANSLVAYLLHLSPIDPLAHDLVFERFLSPERQGTPDIDLDFEAQRREEVIQYLYRRYGAAHTAMACTFVTFHTRSALRDIGKVLDLSPQVMDAALQRLAVEASSDDETEQASIQLLLELCRQIHHFPRHLGIHNGGMVMMGAPLAERLPTEPATMPGRVVVQWDKEALEEVGLVKIDLLGLRMLSAITETTAVVKETTGQVLDLDNLPFTDPAVYEMITSADTLGVFQVESRAQAQMLPQLQPRCFNDLVVAISLIRPGPIQGNMVHPYLRRRLGLEPVSYLHPRLEPALAETLGVILFQEQVLKVARDLAGFSPGQGEQLRRAMGAKQAENEIERFKAAFLAGAQAQGVSLEIAEAIFEQLRAFGSYAFAKSHAATFAVIVYQSAWLKHYHPAAYLCGLLNNQPMGFWPPAVLVGDARRRGLLILPVNLPHSQAHCSVEGKAVRLGFNYIAGLGEESAARLVKAREASPFRELADFCRRTRLPRRVIENLILAGAMDGWNLPRRKLLWMLGQLRYPEEALDLDFSAQEVTLPPLSSTEAMLAEYRVLGLSTGDQVMARYRSLLKKRGISGIYEIVALPDRQWVQTAGLVVVHQAPPTAKGVHFLTLEDEAGLLDIIVRPQLVPQLKKLPTWQGYGLSDMAIILVEGTVQRNGEVVSLLATRIQPLAIID